MKPVLPFVAPLALIALGVPLPARAGAATDGSVGPVQTLSGRFTVPQTLGTLRGGNLFHSFARFSIAPGESATFTTTDAGIRHVVSRVTGGEASLLQGPLALQAAAGSRPDFWFVNPSGITVGAGASFDVPAGLHLATAQQVRFADGSAWSTTGAAGSSLSVAEPQAFGFLGGAAAAAIAVDQAELAPRGPLTLAAGRIDITDSMLSPGDAGLRLWAAGAQAATVPVAAASGRPPGDPQPPAADSSATLRISGSLVETVATGPHDGGALDLAAGGAVTVRDSLVATDTSSSGRGGPVRVQAATLELIAPDEASDRTQLGSNGRAGTGDAGAVTIDLSGRLSIRGAVDLGSIAYAGGGPGDVRVNAGSVDLDGGVSRFAGIFSQSEASGRGRGGSVTLNVRQGLTLVDGALVSTSTRGSGDAGPVRVSADTIDLDGGDGTRGFTGFSASTNVGSSGNGGLVSVDAARSLRVAGGAEISSNTFSAGSAGEVRIRAAAVDIDGTGADPEVSTGFFSIASRGSSGHAGVVTVESGGLVRLVEGGSIASSTFGSGNAGGVVMQARDVSIVGVASGDVFTGISSQANPASTGRAGSVRVAATGALAIRRGGTVSSSTFAAGDAGDVRISAGSIEIDGSGTAADTTTGIGSNAYRGSSGHAGTVSVEAAGSIRIVDGGDISSGTFSSGNAGGVTVQARDIEIVGLAAGGGFTGISSQANSGSSGRAGSVQVTASGALAVRRGGSVSSSTFAGGDAGGVRIRAGSIEIDGTGAHESLGTGVFSSAFRGSRGHAGTVTVESDGLVQLVDGGEISSGTFGIGQAGGVSVQARAIEIVGAATGGGFTGISSRANEGSRGSAGSVQVTTSQQLAIRRGGSVSSSTFAEGNAGDVRIRAGSVEIDGSGTDPDLSTGIVSNAYRGSLGNAGTVTVESDGLVRVVEGGDISSSTFSSGQAGGVVIQAREVEVLGVAAGGVFTGISSQANAGSGRAGSVRVDASGGLAIRRGGSVSSSTFADGDAGDVRIRAGSVDIDGSGADAGVSTGIVSNAYRGSRGNAGTVTVESGGRVRIAEAGDISSGTFSSGHAGGVVVQARDIEIVGQAGGSAFTGISSQANSRSSGRAGSVRVEASGVLAIRRGGTVSSSTFADGDAGDVRVGAGSVEIDGTGTETGVSTGIVSNANTGSRGHAGTVTVQSGGRVRIVSAGDISSGTFSSGNAGGVVVQARDIEIVGVASGGRFTGISSQANPSSSGRAGSVRVEASGGLSVRRSGTVSSSTFASGDAGSVHIAAGSIELDSQGASGVTGIVSNAGRGSHGHAGTVAVESPGALRIVDAGDISSSTFGAGNAGGVVVKARDIEIVGDAAGTRVTGIGSTAERGSTGRAGSVRVEASGGLAIRQGGSVSSSTFAPGAAGDVQIDAATVAIDGDGVRAGTTGVFSEAGSASAGQPGSIALQVRGALELRDGGTLSIANFARVADGASLQPTAITVRAGSLSLVDADIFADATANASASRLDLQATGAVSLRNSSISTAANDGDGGAIRLQGLQRIALVDSSITTSVFGTRGNGGDIRIETPALVLRSGFIQANTAAARAQGGDVRIDAPLLVPDGSNVFIGGNRVERVTTGVAGFNVIQAAAPEGLSGTLDVTLPQLSLSGALAGLSTARIDFGLLGRDACYADEDSSFTRPGRGALPPQPGQPIRVLP